MSIKNQFISFLRIRTAMVGISIILLTFFIAVFAYTIAPDHTPNANRQTLEIQARPPGFKQLFLVLPDSRTKNSFSLKGCFFGKIDYDKWIPIKSIA
jgi:peptide/nickel transport system permease protein